MARPACSCVVPAVAAPTGAMLLFVAPPAQGSPKPSKAEGMQRWDEPLACTARAGGFFLVVVVLGGGEDQQANLKPHNKAVSLKMHVSCAPTMRSAQPLSRKLSRSAAAVAALTSTMQADSPRPAQPGGRA